MSKLVWDPKPYVENGLDRGVLYPANGPGLVWNGLSSAKVSTDRSEITSYFLDGIKYGRATDDGVPSGTITSLTYPKPLESDDCATYGLSYRVAKGATPDLGYRLHIFYDAILLPGERSRVTATNGSSLTNFEWTITTVPTAIATYGPSAHFIIDSETAYPWMMQAIEGILYGSDTTSPRLPSVDELISMFEQYSILIVTDYGDGRFSAEGPDNVVKTIDTDSFYIDWFSAIPMLGDDYEVRTA